MAKQELHIISKNIAITDARRDEISRRLTADPKNIATEVGTLCTRIAPEHVGLYRQVLEPQLSHIVLPNMVADVPASSARHLSNFRAQTFDHLEREDDPDSVFFATISNTRLSEHGQWLADIAHALVVTGLNCYLFREDRQKRLEPLDAYWGVPPGDAYSNHRR
jgi:hypothetical protein